MNDLQISSSIMVEAPSVTQKERSQSNESFKDITFSIPQLADIFDVSMTILYELEKNEVIKGRVVKKAKSETKVYGWNDVAIIAERFAGRISKPAEHLVKVFANLKGGTGKSTISAQFAMRASCMGIRTLVIDLDPQGHATQILGLKESETENLATIRDVIIESRPINEIILKITPYLSLIPANLDLSVLETELVAKTAREQRIPKVIQDIRNQWDLIIIDTNPSASIVNLSAILAADELCIVAATDPMAVSGITKMFRVLKQIDEDFGGTPPTRIIANQFDVREAVCQESVGFLRTNYRQFLTKTVVRKNTDIKEAQKLGQAIWQFKRRSSGAEDIVELTKELLREAPSA